MKRNLILLLAALLSAACSKKEAPSEVKASTPKPKIEVTAALAESRSIERIVNVTGSLAPDETTNVSTEVSGRVDKVHADFGSFVKKGQLLAELQQTEISLNLERGRANLAQALARVGLDPNQATDRPTSTPAIRQAEALMLDARSRYENAKRLVATGDIAKERFEGIEKEYQARSAALEAMRDDLRVQLANIAALRADVGILEKRLRDTRLYAPFDGQISQRMAAPGQYIKENTPYFTIVKNYPLRLRVDIPETAVMAVRPGTEVTFTTDAIPGASFQAVVREINPSLDPRSRSLNAEARLKSNDPRLKPGMFVQVQLVAARGVQAVMVPKEALLEVAGLTKLFTVRDGKAVEHRITPGTQSGGLIEVTGANVQPGDTVVTSSLPSLVTGAELAVKNTPAPSGMPESSAPAAAPHKTAPAAAPATKG